MEVADDFGFGIGFSIARELGFDDRYELSSRWSPLGIGILDGCFLFRLRIATDFPGKAQTFRRNRHSSTTLEVSAGWSRNFLFGLGQDDGPS